MGSATSRESSSRHKHRRKLPSLRSHPSSNSSSKDTFSTSPHSKHKHTSFDPQSTKNGKLHDNEFKPNTSVSTIYPFRQATPVRLVKHQVVLSDHVPPLSSLSAVTVPKRSLSWRKSLNLSAISTPTIAAPQLLQDGNSMLSSSSYYGEGDDDEDGLSSPRTSLGSDYTNNRKQSKIDDYVATIDNKKKKKKSSSFTFNLNNKGNIDIVFESKFNGGSRLDNATISASSKHNDEKMSNVLAKNPLKPFWSHNTTDDKEYDRQMRQHYVLKQVLGGNIHVPVSSDHITVLDSACGVGIWTLDMAQAFPHATIIGLDTFPYSSAEDTKDSSNNANTAATLTAALNAPNIVYKNGDLSSRLSLPTNYLDIIFQRDTTSIIPQERWTFLLSEYCRILKPGGYIELVEYDFDIRDPGPVLALVNEWYQIASSSVGVDPDQAKKLKSELVSAGFENVQAKVVSIPIGEWPKDKEQREKGFLYKQVINALFKSMRPWWIMELGVSEEEYDKIISAAMDEFEEQCCYIDWIIYTATKPVITSGASTKSSSAQSDNNNSNDDDGNSIASHRSG